MTLTRRFPAEWEPVEAVLLAWPHENTDWQPLLHYVRECYSHIIEAVSKRAKVIVIGPEKPEGRYISKGTVKENVSFIQLQTNDTWTRDYGPVSMLSSAGSRILMDYKFNGWGLKFASDCDNLATSRLHSNGVLKGELVNRLGFVLEGGSVESDGKGTILTSSNCLLSPNRNGDKNRGQIEEQLKADLNAQKILWIENGELEGDDTDGHIDTLARLLPDDTIVYVSCDRVEDSHYESLKAMENELKSMTSVDEKPFHLIGLPLPEPMYDPEDGSRLPATYANFLLLNGAVLLPVYGQALDAVAVDVMKKALPDYEIVPIDCSALVRQHGSLHCATMQIPKER
ncbi:MAG: agmatine deiminase family protein [Muribaculaceae bacterium]|nr:agmatine deiminase family protein [Muribaculaceae bacterium]